MKIVIAGAGASGLIAANLLAKAGAEVLLLEATERIGGRIHTFTPPGFTSHVEAGAEFIHGDLKLTLSLMQKAGLAYKPAIGEMYEHLEGKIQKQNQRNPGWQRFYKLLSENKKDMTLEDFLNVNFFEPKYLPMCKSVRQMAQGLDLADFSKLSLLSIREEWLSEEMQYRPLAGYAPMLEFLHNSAAGNNYSLEFNSKVIKIEWKERNVKVSTNNNSYFADAVIISVPLGSYRRKEIEFSPQIDPQLKQFEDIGFGKVIKIALEFKYAFWENDFSDMGFLFGENGYTFWTQLSDHRPLLTGWIGDGYVNRYENDTDEALIDLAIETLSNAFGSGALAIRELLKAVKVFRYNESSAPGGGYSWLTMKSRPAIKTINKGIADTVFFCGEALHPRGDVGTVEAALQSGRYTANKILRLCK